MNDKSIESRLPIAGPLSLSREEDEWFDRFVNQGVGTPVAAWRKVLERRGLTPKEIEHILKNMGAVSVAAGNSVYGITDQEEAGSNLETAHMSPAEIAELSENITSPSAIEILNEYFGVPAEAHTSEDAKEFTGQLIDLMLRAAWGLFHANEFGEQQIANEEFDALNLLVEDKKRKLQAIIDDN